MNNKKLVLDEFLPYQLSRSSEHVSRLFARRYSSQFSLTVSQWRVLAVLGENYQLIADDICKITGMDKVTISRAINELEKQGRVTRLRCKQDGRQVNVKLSDNGKKIYRQIVPIADSFEEQLASFLSVDELNLFNQLLIRLMQFEDATIVD